MADSNFERFKKRFPNGVPADKIEAIPPPVPGPGGLGRYVVGRGVQAGIKKLVGEAKPVRSSGPKSRKPAEAKTPKPKAPKKPKKPTEPRDSGTLTSKSRISDVRKSRGPYPVPALRRNTLPAVRGSNAVTRADTGGRALVKFKEPGKPAVRPTGTPSTGRGPTVRVNGATSRAMLGSAGAGMMAGGYYAAKKMAEKDRAAAAVKDYRTETDKTGKGDRPSNSVKLISKDRLQKIQKARAAEKVKSFKDLRQGQVKKKAAQTFAKPEKPFNAFEKSKMRTYEKEGYGGRFLKSPKAQVLKERGYKFSDLFKKKK